MDFFPVTDDGPLCRMMDDPAFWAWALADHDDRQAVKRAVKRLPRRGGFGAVIKVDRDDVMGRAGHQLMKTPHGRNLLYGELAKRIDDSYQSEPLDLLAQSLFQNLTREEAWFKPLEGHLTEDTVRDLRFLTPTGLSAYLEQEGPPSDEARQRWLAGLVASFALVSPDKRTELIQFLVDLGAPYDSWFSIEA